MEIFEEKGRFFEKTFCIVQKHLIPVYPFEILLLSILRLKTLRKNEKEIIA